VGVGLLRVGGVGRATDRAALSPVAWAPEGEQFAYGTRGGVWVHELGDLVGTRIAAGDAVTAVAWSRAAGYLAYVDRGGLRTVLADGSDPREIPVQGTVRLPVWAPAGDRMAFVIRAPDQGRAADRIWLASPDGALLRPILWETRGHTIAALAWFPDVLHLFASLVPPGGEAAVEWWKVRIAYPDFRRLPGPPRPSLESVLSPDGSRIAFVAAEAGGERAYVVRLDGGGLRALSDGARRVGGLSWSPHGDKLALAVLQTDAQAEVYAVSAATGARVLVTSYRLEFPDPGASLSLVWSPDERKLAYGTNTGSHRGPVWVARFQPR
jgi:hypothetical protein